MADWRDLQRRYTSERIKQLGEECGFVPIDLYGPRKWWPPIRDGLKRNTDFFDPLPADLRELDIGKRFLIISWLKFNEVPGSQCEGMTKRGHRCQRRRTFDHRLCAGHRRVSMGQPFFRRINPWTLPDRASPNHGHGFYLTGEQGPKRPVGKGKVRPEVHFGEKDMQLVPAPVCDAPNIQEMTSEPSLVTCEKCVWVLRLEYNCGW